MNVRRSNSHRPILSPISEAAPLGERSILDAEAFRRMIALERKRSERSRKPFMLLLLGHGRRPALREEWEDSREDSVRTLGFHSRYRRYWMVFEQVCGWSHVHRNLYRGRWLDPSYHNHQGHSDVTEGPDLGAVQPGYSVVSRLSGRLGSRRSRRVEQSHALPGLVAA